MTRPGLRTLAGAVAAVALAVAAFAGVASAQQANERLTIRLVDTTQFPEVRIQALSVGAQPDLADFLLRENGRLVNDFRLVPVDQTGLRMAVVLVIDVSRSMAENDKMTQARQAAAQFVQQKRPDDEIALVTFGDRPSTVVDFTRDPAPLLEAIGELGPIGGTTLYDGVRHASAMFEDVPGLQPNMVVLSDGNDTGSTNSLDQAKAGVLASRTAVFALGLTGQEFNDRPLRELADTSGGVYLSTDDPTTLSTLYSQVSQTLQSQYEIRYTSQTDAQTLELVLTAANLQATASTQTGTLAEGIGTAPQVVDPASGPFTGSLGKWVGAFLALVAVGLAVYAIARLLVREESHLTQVMRQYDEGVPAAEGAHGLALSETPIIQRAVAFTEQFAERQGVLPKVARMLEKADLPLRAGEALFFYAAFVLLVAALVLLLAPSIAAGLLAIAILALLPPATLAFLAGRRQRKFTSLLPDTLQLLSGSLRAGYSLMQGVDTVSQEVSEPMGKELRRVVAESRLGRPLEDALTDCADRMESADFAWAVMAINIQREVGGNLAELLQTVAETMIARERLRREVRALTAEGRISAIVLGILPIGLGLVMYTLNPDYIETLFDDGLGQVMLIGAGILALVGFYWMKKTIEIEI